MSSLQAATQDKNDLRIPITVLPALFFHFPFLLHQYTSRFALADNTYRVTTPQPHHAAAVRSLLLSHFSLPFVLASLSIQSYHWPPRVRRYYSNYTKLRHIGLVALMYIRPPVTCLSPRYSFLPASALAWAVSSRSAN